MRRAKTCANQRHGDLSSLAFFEVEQLKEGVGEEEEEEEGEEGEEGREEKEGGGLEDRAEEEGLLGEGSEKVGGFKRTVGEEEMEELRY